MIKLSPAKKVEGELIIPGDKSISHRVIILGSLGKGKSILTGLSTGADVQSTRKIFTQLGVKILQEKGKFEIEGVGKFGFKESNNILNCGNSGTSARLISGILSGQKFFSILTGDDSLKKRPMKRVVTPLKQMGAKIWGRENNSLLSIAIQGSDLRGVEYKSPVASAQVKTAILLAGLLAEGSTKVIEPALSRDHTERLFSWLDLPIQKDGLSSQISPSEIPNFSLNVPGDFSSAAYFIALGVLHQKSNLTLRDVNLNETRIGFSRILERMGAKFEIEQVTSEPEPVGNIQIFPSELKNIEIKKSEIPSFIDELPLLAVVATQAKGEMRVTGAQELRVKESDRISGIVKPLQKMGANIKELPDGLVVSGPTPLNGAKVKSNGDHRIAMSLTIAALLAEGETTLMGEQWVTISFPEFFELIKKIVKE